MTYQTQAEQFLANIFSGRMDLALKACADDVVFIGARPEPSDRVAAYGRHVGHDGAERFFQTFADTLEPGDFKVDATIAQDRHVVMYGNLKHTARATGRPFVSDWALVMRFNDDGRLALYHFYEDTAALEWALGSNG